MFAQEEHKPWHAQEKFQEEEKFKAWLADEEAEREKDRVQRQKLIQQVISHRYTYNLWI